ncbi:hypothetical protein ZEAMMB73_Zm00001d035558 [Zea mays]|uniref:Uncharacterized protein n=1 Tax=Zea mays TaxID=4577 RepID=A0A1D6LH62_MAIZE|nr:hypothetical protein ZEAMMB73_Zm00001d035558 [Zea mays]
MENPPSILVTPMAPAMSAQFTRITFSNLFVRRAGPGSTELTVEGRPSDQLGRRNLTDSPVFDGRGPDASLVARVQGVATQMGNVRKLDLGDAEYVKEVSGTYGAFEGATTLTSFRIVTSTARAWGPWGIESGTRFCITAPIGSSIVGFYGRATTRLVAAIGVYLRQL